MWLGTFHSLGARILRRHAPRLGWSSTFTIYDQDQSLRQIKQAQQELGIDPKSWNPKIFRAHISGAKNQLVSVQELIEETEGSFDIMQDEIRGNNGSVIIFKGMQTYNADNIKSLEGYDIAWVEEAQTCSQHSLDLLRPTIRKPQSEMWFSWNPRYKTLKRRRRDSRV